MKPSERVSEIYGENEKLLNAELAKILRGPIRPDDPRAIMLLVRSLVEYLDEQHEKQRDDSKSLIR